jgi:hypothetical protein
MGEPPATKRGAIYGGAAVGDPAVRSLLLSLAQRVEALEPGNVRRFNDEQSMIAHQLRQLAHDGVVNGPRRDTVRGWRSPGPS